MAIALLYEMQTPLIALLYHYALAIVVEAIVGETTTTLWWRSWCHAGDDDDHGAPKMEIKRSKTILAISCHFFDCM